MLVLVVVAVAVVVVVVALVAEAVGLVFGCASVRVCACVRACDGGRGRARVRSCFWVGPDPTKHRLP